jgi:hypothetical protein
LDRGHKDLDRGPEGRDRARFLVYFAQLDAGFEHAVRF